MYCCEASKFDTTEYVTNLVSTGIGTGAKKQQRRALLSIAERGYSQFDTVPQLVQHCQSQEILSQSVLAWPQQPLCIYSGHQVAASGLNLFQA